MMKRTARRPVPSGRVEAGEALAVGLALSGISVVMLALATNLVAAGLLALRDVAEAYGGLGMVAEQAGISREALYRSLSPKGNPTLKTLLAVLKSVGMRLSVEPENQVHA